MNKNPLRGFGYYLGMIRAQLGITQAEAADIANVSRQTWNRWEKAKSAPTGRDIRAAVERIAPEGDERIAPERAALLRHIEGEMTDSDAATSTEAMAKLIEIIHRHGVANAMTMLRSFDDAMSSDPSQHGPPKKITWVVHHGPTEIAGLRVDEMRAPYHVEGDTATPAADAVTAKPARHASRSEESRKSTDGQGA